MAVIELKEISKTYDGGVDAVKDVSLTVADGEFVVLVGPSGCGKSTILRMIAGLEDISKGEILVGDKVVNSIPPKDRNVAMVFQNYALYPHMTVAQNIGFGLSLRHVKKDQIRKTVESAAEMLGLRNELDRRPGELSGGQRQRVALGRAIVRNPAVFLFDEPLSNLDARLRSNMRLEIAQLHQRLGTTMMYVTHDQVEAMTMGSRIVVMNEGRILQVDTPLNVYHNPATTFVATFIGSPPMNLYAAVVQNSASPVLTIPELAAELPLAGPLFERLSGLVDVQVTVGIRPEGFIHCADMTKTEKSESDMSASDHEAFCSIPLDFEVDLAEPMGNEIILHLRRYQGKTIARIHSHEVPPIGSTVRFRVDLAKASFFDAQSGERAA